MGIPIESGKYFGRDFVAWKRGWGRVDLCSDPTARRSILIFERTHFLTLPSFVERGVLFQKGYEKRASLENRRFLAPSLGLVVVAAIWFTGRQDL